MLDEAWLAFVALLVTIDPIGLVPIFIALTRHLDDAERRRIATRGTLIAALVLALFALAGESVLRVMGIGLPAFRIAGGVTLMLFALEMVFERRSRRRGETAGNIKEEHDPGGLAVFPLAVPLIAGPAAITTVMLQAAASGGATPRRLAALAALSVTLVLVWLALRLASRLDRMMGPTLVTVLSRLLGLLLAAVAVQFILDGVRSAFALP